MMRAACGSPEDATEGRITSKPSRNSTMYLLKDYRLTIFSTLVVVHRLSCSYHRTNFWVSFGQNHKKNPQ